MQVPSLIFNQMIVMAQQTAVDYLIEQLQAPCRGIPSHIIEQAKQMEKEQRIKDYNAGYIDAQCNHINDAENYVNEQEYLNETYGNKS